MERFEWHPTEMGTPQGGVISPLLANIALHGMEECLGITEVSSTYRVVRYADDFVVACTTREDAEQAINKLTPWLAERGLELSKEKTRIVHIEDGFDFLGYNLRQYKAPRKQRGVTFLIKPNRDSVKKIRRRLRDEWATLNGHNAREVTKRLNPIIRGWANYFRNSSSYQAFQVLDVWMFRRAVRYIRRMHPKKPAKWQRDRY